MVGALLCHIDDTIKIGINNIFHKQNLASEYLNTIESNNNKHQQQVSSINTISRLLLLTGTSHYCMMNINKFI